MRTFLLFSALLLSLLPAGLKAQQTETNAFQNTTGDITEAAQSVRFYPNPVTNVLSITPSADMSHAFLFVSDVRGRIVAKAALPDLPGGQEYHYQMNDFSEGIYICILQTAGQQFSQRIMVQ
jgi:hypothetical protein